MTGNQRLALSVGVALAGAAADLSAITDAPLLEAEILLAHALDTSRATLLAHPERPLSTAQLTAYQALVLRRAANYPLPYLTGRAEFYGLEFEVTPDVLIPRPETETLVDLALARRPATIVDVGTGSGCIAIALAARLSRATVYATDVSPAALAVARRNAERHSVSNGVHLLAGDLLAPCSAPFDSACAEPVEALRAGPVDLIVSNPPYIAQDEFASLPISVRDHEPRLALDGGPDGLAVIRRLLAQAPAVLRPGGAILIEIGAGQGTAVLQLARTAFPGAVCCIHSDLAGRDRVLEIQT